MKFVKTALAGSKVFEQYPTWLGKIVKQLSTGEALPFMVKVHKESFRGKNSYFFEIFEKQMRLIVQQVGESHARMFVLCRGRITQPTARLPKYEAVGSEEGCDFKLDDEAAMQHLQTLMQLQLTAETGYPLAPERLIQVSNMVRGWEIEGQPSIFAGRIVQFNYARDEAVFVVEAMSLQGPVTHSVKIPLKVLKGSHAKVGKWLIYSPNETFASITSEREMQCYFQVAGCNTANADQTEAVVA